MRLQFVLGSHSASLHPTTGASNWIVRGQVGSSRGEGLSGEWKKGEWGSSRRELRGLGAWRSEGGAKDTAADRENGRAADVTLLLISDEADFASSP